MEKKERDPVLPPVPAPDDLACRLPLVPHYSVIQESFGDPLISSSQGIHVCRSVLNSLASSYIVWGRKPLSKWLKAEKG